MLIWLVLAEYADAQESMLACYRRAPQNVLLTAPLPSGLLGILAAHNQLPPPPRSTGVRDAAAAGGGQRGGGTV
jgi:hypothetical protein